MDGGDDDNWGMVGKATVSAKLLRLQKDIVVTHFSSVWESSIDGERGTFSPHWFRSFQCARSSSMLHRRNLPLQLSSEDFPFENAQIFQTNQHNQSVFGIVRDKIQKALHLYLSHPILFSVFVTKSLDVQTILAALDVQF